MDRGAALCVDEACLSAKIFLGMRIFIPSFL